MGSPKVSIYTDKVENILPCLPPNSYDACFCDPPYHLTQISRGGSSRTNNPETPFGRTRLGSKGFMGKTWDGGDVAFRPEIWQEVLRVLKPGAMLLAFGGTRTFHRLTCAIEDVGFEIRDCLMWLYGSGFPKSHDISKSMYRKLGGQRKKILGVSIDESVLWQGYGTALKPAYEPIICAMKPLVPGMTYVQNALAYGVAGLNIDGSRIAKDVNDISGWSKTGSCEPENKSMSGKNYDREPKADNSSGRWPANLVLDEESAAILDKQSGDCPTGNLLPHHRLKASKNLSMSGMNQERNPSRAFGGDSGGASRFFYCAKVSPSERNLGDISCQHPTLKPLKLTEYLSRLILPPAREALKDLDDMSAEQLATIYSACPALSPRSLLVPFSGAGSEVIGASLAGWDLITGIEEDEQSVEWSRARIDGIQLKAASDISGDNLSSANRTPVPSLTPSVNTNRLSSLLRSPSSSNKI